MSSLKKMDFSKLDGSVKCKPINIVKCKKIRN